jgi:hypothetical protein
MVEPLLSVVKGIHVMVDDGKKTSIPAYDTTSAGSQEVFEPSAVEGHRNLQNDNNC